MEFDYEQSVWGLGTASLSWFDPTRPRLKNALQAISVLSNSEQVLELGCGAGQFIRAIKNIRPDLNCFGCDISQQAIGEAKKIDSLVNYDFSTEEKLPYADGQFKAVFIFDVLEHVKNPVHILKEVRRVLADGGLFHCFVPCEADKLSLWNFLGKFGLGQDLTKKYAGHIQQFSRPSFFKLIVESGFMIEKKRYSSHLIGQVLDVVVFNLMDRASKNKSGQQINNESFFNTVNNNHGNWFLIFKKIINLLINVESSFFSHCPSSNIHLTSKKS